MKNSKPVTPEEALRLVTARRKRSKDYFARLYAEAMAYRMLMTEHSIPEEVADGSGISEPGPEEASANEQREERAP